MMQHFPILAIMVLFLGAFLTALAGKSRLLRGIFTCGATLTAFVLMLCLVRPVMIEQEIIAYWLGGWQPAGGYAIGIGLTVDALSLFFALIVTFTLVVSALFSRRYMERTDALDKYDTLFLMLGGGVLGLTMTGDLFNLFIMVEIMTFAAVALTAFRNYKPIAAEGAFKYLITGAIGSSLILLGTVLIYAQLHTLSMAQISVLVKDHLTPVTVLAFGFLLTGFCLKCYLVPFHPVAVDAYTAAPASIAMTFAGMVNKAGVYALIRLVYTIFHSMNVQALQYLLVTLGTLTMFVGVTMALSQHDFKRLLAYHSISQIGYVIAAIGLSTGLGIAGGLYHALNHTLFKGLLFLCAGAVFYAAGTTDLNRLGGLAKRMPQTAIIFLIGAFSISGLPPFNGFVSKWVIYQATFRQAAATGHLFYALVTVMGLVVSVMTLASFIKVSQSVFFGQLPAEFEQVREAPLSMRLPMWLMALLCIGTGLFPRLVSGYLTTPAADAALNVGDYIQAMMGADYAEGITGHPVPIPQIDYELAGYWSPVAWLVLFMIILGAVTIATLLGQRQSGHVMIATDAKDAKYDTFFGGEKSEHSHVGGSDLFWGLRYNLRHYFGFLSKAHSGVINDYVLWLFLALAMILVFMFIFIS